jgi:hypothetical protein
MVAALWTATAVDITADRSLWDKHLTAQELNYRIARLADRRSLVFGSNLGKAPSPATILDSLNRNPQPDDPQHAIYRPAARLGPSRLASAPMWAPEQADRYVELLVVRATKDQDKRKRAKDLPTLTVAEAAERGLGTLSIVAALVDMHVNSLYRLQRVREDFPPVQALLSRQPGEKGPPAGLRNVADTLAWIEATEPAR